MSALSDYSDLVRARFGDRVEGIYLYGSRARGDHRPESDTDVAVVLTGGDFWKDLFELVDLAFEINAVADVYIQPRPVSAAEWDAQSAPGTFVAEVKKDATPAEYGLDSAIADTPEDPSPTPPHRGEGLTPAVTHSRRRRVRAHQVVEATGILGDVDMYGNARRMPPKPLPLVGRGWGGGFLSKAKN